MNLMNIWVLLKVIYTLHIQDDHHVRRAGIIANFLSDHEDIEKVLLPGLDNDPH